MLHSVNFPPPGSCISKSCPEYRGFVQPMRCSMQRWRTAFCGGPAGVLMLRCCAQLLSNNLLVLLLVQSGLGPILACVLCQFCLCLCTSIPLPFRTSCQIVTVPLSFCPPPIAPLPLHCFLQPHHQGVLSLVIK